MKICKRQDITGRVHSIETFGTLEGPGIRFVVFLQGCLARCLYCQNPDTWELKSGTCMTAAQIFGRIRKCLPYINSSNGGITVSGGEPLLQPDFLIKLLGLCKKENIHTAMDTSAFYHLSDKPKLKKIFLLTDLFIVDIKAPFEDLHEKITSRRLSEVLKFIRMLEDNKRDYWVRYVLVPGLNDSKKDLEKLGFIVKDLKFCRRFEFLPYHTLGRHKWEYMKLGYPLAGVKSATSENLEKSESIFKKALEKYSQPQLKVV